MLILERFNEVVGKLPTTPFKIVVGAWLAVITGVVYLVMLYMGKDKGINEYVFTAWLAFVAAWATLSYAQFKAKRETEFKEEPTKIETPVGVTSTRTD